MARRPIRRRPTYQPLTFSSFARLIASLTNTNNMFNRQRRRSNFHDNTMDVKFQQQAESSDSSDEEQSNGEVRADFLFFDPKPEDFHGIKTLLQTYLDNKSWDLSGFVDLILGQTTVGSVVKLEDDEDNGIFSVVSALNLGRYKDNKCIQELKEYLLRVCKEKDVIDKLRSLLGEKAHSVGLLVSQRVMNLPPQLFPPIYDGLFKEVSWATEDEPTEELRNSFRFKFYIVVSKIYKRKNLNEKKRHKSDYDEATIYTKPEDEIFHKLSLWSFDFPLQTQQVNHELRNYQPMGLVMAVEADKISAFQQELRSLIVDESLIENQS
ncbi:protein BCCIP homolog [Ziziphus jujuba]|uniref:Protein BCCIP homolog n=1 Tax=Ziziphus jujuba TaxID=326968 RepID=A0A6P4AF17_ZIZJJ|nr:protein BCCIP homolog [Ziziphus jujuba]